MPEHDPYRLFVTHAWQVHDDYVRLFEYLGEVESFFYECLSDPENPPDNLTDRLALEQRLAERIQRCEAVVALASVFDEAPEIISIQLGLARKHGKPVIGLRPLGTHKVAPEFERQVTDMVIWNERMIVDMIKLHTRGEKTDRFEVIEFEP